jgi:protein-L-isoaspartate(D-aspartate) O-methyltransferase
MTIQSPIPDYSAARQAMVENQLRPQGVTDRAVLDAMGTVERERFLPAPAVLAQLLTQMAPQAGDRALVIGAGSGYSAAVLSAIGVDVTAVESSPELVKRAAEAGATVLEGPLEAGHKKAAPYDLILIDGAVQYLPEPIIAQLADGGRLGTALVDRGITRLIVGRKAGDAFGFLSIGDAGVPMLPGFSRRKAFTF